MFENYQNLDTRYVPNNRDMYRCPTNEHIQTPLSNKPYEMLNDLGELVGYFWYYGNSVVLSFDIVGEYTSEQSNTYVDVLDVISNCSVTLTMYDFRHNIVYQESKSNLDSSSVDFIIDATKSSKLLKGKYTIQLVLSNDMGYSETLFSVNDCILEVR